jgi:hypothetical protein
MKGWNMNVVSDDWRALLGRGPRRPSADGR